MKNKSTSSLTALLSVIVGVLLIVWHGDGGFLNVIVMVIGALVGVVGLGVFIAQVAQKKGERNYGWMVLGLLATAAGIWLLADSSFFVAFVVYVLAVVLILAGLWHMWTLKVFNRTYRVPAWLWFIPALLIVAGVSFIFMGFRIAAGAIVLAAGICLILSGCNSFMEKVDKMRNRDEVRNGDRQLPSNR